MIYQVFVLLVFLGVVLITLAYFFSIPHFSIVGFSFLFLLGVVLMSSGLMVKTGEQINTTYMNDTNPNVFQVEYTVSSYNYEAFSGTYAHLFGLLLALCGGFGFGLSLMDLYNNNGGFSG